ncbi:MAG TPA: FtsL-like putative cell division protein [Flavipsychrobacter sp.]|nr:FtsL-like putative cell division protein [Flavipsychrobacter sp.]
MNEANHIREEEQESLPDHAVKNDWQAMVEKLSYKGIVHNIPYLSFLVFLCVLYITNSQRTIQTQRVLNKKNEELKELRWKYMDIKSQLMSAGMETEIIRNAAHLGLKPMMLPAYRIETEEKNIVSK